MSISLVIVEDICSSHLILKQASLVIEMTIDLGFDSQILCTSSEENELSVLEVDFGQVSGTALSWTKYIRAFNDFFSQFHCHSSRNP